MFSSSNYVLFHKNLQDKYGNPPGIIREAKVEPLPRLFKQMIERMVRWGVLPRRCIPDSCIVNIYEEGDCIPPHIDHHDFLRPFCTVSLLSNCNILFGSNLKIVAAGEFEGPAKVWLPTGYAFFCSYLFIQFFHIRLAALHIVLLQITSQTNNFYHFVGVYFASTFS